jgi:hypothetical protein
MKNRKTSIDHTFMQRADVLQSATMAQVKGGTTNTQESEWDVVYIDGKPYLVRRNSAGEIIEMKPFP